MRRGIRNNAKAKVTHEAAIGTADHGLDRDNR